MYILAAIVVALVVANILSGLPGRGWVRAATERDLEEAGVLYLRRSMVFVVAGDGAPVALSAVSPHLEHRLLYCPSNETFVGRHGELFDRLGLYVDGPSSRGMDRVAVRVRDGLVEVNPSEVTPGPGRDAGTRQDPTGRYCEVPGPEDPPGFAVPAP